VIAGRLSRLAAARRQRAERAAWERRLATRLDVLELHARLGAAIRDRRPYALGRPGFYEAALVAHALASGPPYPDRLRHVARVNVGIEHTSDADLDAFAMTTLGAMAGCDLLGATDDPIPNFLAAIERVQRDGLELVGHSQADPRDALDLGGRPFTAELAGRRLLVVHPFARTIERQYARRREVTGVRDLLPDLDLVTLVPPVTFAGASTGRRWHDELAATTARIAALEFDVAIVGAGGYGLPIAAFVRSLGRVGVHLAGATQLLFGIRGRRWRDVPRIAQEMDDTWVAPDPSELPPAPERVEGGAYW